MKTSKHRFPDPLTFFRRCKRLSKLLSISLSFCLLCLFNGCSYYRVEPITPESNQDMREKIAAFNEADKYIILHHNGSSYHLKDASIKSDSLILEGSVENLSVGHLPKKYPQNGRTYRYYSKKTTPLNEVHIYLDSPGQPEIGKPIRIKMSEISSVGMSEANHGRTFANIFFSAVATFFVINLIALALKSSCPFVYGHDGSQLVFMGELYPGNIIREAQRTDFLLLPGIRPDQGKYSLIISNELREIQHTDLTELMVIDHPPSSQVLLDTRGKPVLFRDVTKAHAAFVDGRKVHVHPASEKDGYSFTFDTPDIQNNGRREVVLRFRKPLYASSANIMLSARNSIWLDYVFGKFNEKFGAAYPAFQKQQQEKNYEETLGWMQAQNLPLTLKLKVGDEWQTVETFYTAGPMAFRELAATVDLTKIPGSEIELKLETGFKFWEVDFAGLDFDITGEVQVKSVLPHQATTENGEEVSALLTATDGRYVTQDQVGDYMVVSFTEPLPGYGRERTVFLKNRGYYNYIRDYDGIPDVAALRKFRIPGYFTRFSENEYRRAMPFISQTESNLMSDVQDQNLGNTR